MTNYIELIDSVRNGDLDEKQCRELFIDCAIDYALLQSNRRKLHAPITEEYFEAIKGIGDEYYRNLLIDDMKTLDTLVATLREPSPELLDEMFSEWIGKFDATQREKWNMMMRVLFKSAGIQYE